MNKDSKNSRSKKRQTSEKALGRTHRYIDNFYMGFLVLIMTVIFSITLNSGFVRAEAPLKADEIRHEKHYKSILIEYGDTLWAIASEYKDSHYDSVHDYIDEVMQINHLKNDKIHAGQYLLIPYYDGGFQSSHRNYCAKFTLKTRLPDFLLVVFNRTTNRI